MSSANVVELAESVHNPSITPILDSIFLENSGGMHHCLNVVPIIFEYVTPDKVSLAPQAYVWSSIVCRTS